MARNRTTVYVPLLPATGGGLAPVGRMLALGFEPFGPGEPRGRTEPRGILGHRLREVREQLRHVGSAPVPASGRLRHWRARGCIALEPIPNLVDCAGAGLGLALGLTLGGGYRLLAFGTLDAAAGCIAVAPSSTIDRLLDMLAGLGAQSRPLTCLLPAPDRGLGSHARRLAELAALNLRCHSVTSLDAAIRACTAECQGDPRGSLEMG